MSEKRRHIAECRRALKYAISQLEMGLKEKAASHTIPLLKELNDLDRLDTELAAGGKEN